MYIKIFEGVAIPFVGTLLGSSCVFLLKNCINPSVQRILNGFAGGVMIAASVWSLIIPSIENSSAYGKFAFLPAVIGFWIGVLFLVFINKFFPGANY